jgi:1-acyl-sn-glycerol-3-phosphate acyltransferase
MVLWVCGVDPDINLHGTHPDANERDAVSDGHLIVANHVSWLDILVINHFCATRFVAKSEIGQWPLVGLLVGRAGTIFIERGRRRAVYQVLKEVAWHLTHHDPVGVFPEGTTTTGDELLPFHSNLIQAAVQAERPVLPIALRYSDLAGQRAEAVTFIGDTTFMESVWRVCGSPRIRCEVSVLTAISTNNGQNRRAIADEARARIGHHLNLLVQDN